MNQEILMVKCPTCGEAVLWRPENIYRPFCRERCKLIDLGGWAHEDYTMPVEEGEPLSDEILQN